MSILQSYLICQIKRIQLKHVLWITCCSCSKLDKTDEDWTVGAADIFQCASSGPKESWLKFNIGNLEFHRTACGTRCCYCRLIQQTYLKKIMTATHQPFSWGIDSREQGKMGCCAPRARRVPRSLSRSDFQDLPSPQSFSAWMLQGLRTHPRALQLERWLPAWLLLWTSCWCPEHFAKLQVIKWNPGQLPGTDSHDYLWIPLQITLETPCTVCVGSFRWGTGFWYKKASP